MYLEVKFFGKHLLGLGDPPSDVGHIKEMWLLQPFRVDNKRKKGSP